MTDRCIITSASNKFFPSLINLLGSLHANYPDHPDVYIYDLGLFYTFKKELEEIPWIHILEIPHFVPYWRSCYTWKTYILSHPLARLNFYIDAGCQIQKPLEEIFQAIEVSDYFILEQGVSLGRTVPQEFKSIFKLDPMEYEKPLFTAGVFGFKKDSKITTSLEELYDAAVSGLCLGFSKNELWKNKGVNKTAFIRNCEMFRHDTTLLSLIFRKNIGNIESHSVERFDNKEGVIWNFRMNYRSLEYVRLNAIHKNNSLLAAFNHLVISSFIVLKNARLKVKKMIAL